MDDGSQAISWDTPGNAERYAAYVAKHPLYNLTSQALVEELRLGPGEVVADLCCGTGATTRALLATGAGDLRVFAIDLSQTQLDVARRDITDPRVAFVRAPAERAHEVIAEPCDAVICNAAVWQLKPPAVHAIARLLRGGGRFVFNLPAAFAPEAIARLCRDDPGVVRYARRQADTLEQAMREAHGAAQRAAPPATAGRPATRAGFIEHKYLAALAAEGFRIERTTSQVVPISPEAAFDWYMIPVFRTNVLGGASVEAGEQALRTAYAAWQPSAPEAFALWVSFLMIR
ncbi:MAG TPA: methyltransferase domain-containing protein [Kofleriaceae bacterium]|nr:methyltransferase domain-containing protein [Kofleriaceae bacterium]